MRKEETWKNTYRCKIKDIKDKHVAEFNFKLLYNILSYNAYISKWNRNVSNLCMYCKHVENMKHRNFEDNCNG